MYRSLTTLLLAAALCACQASPHTYTSTNYEVRMPNPLVEERAGELYLQPIEVRSTTASPLTAELTLFDDKEPDLRPDGEPELSKLERKLEHQGAELAFPELAIPAGTERPVLELRLSAPDWEQPATIRKRL